ncbi:MAG: L-histidine N(alpha)-methyltransferase, partial [Flavobacteriaceae bacterium]|nr:L-histidine N(alpha)-methyltransferase [Flavobacteriaceae bacterium]
MIASLTKMEEEVLTGLRQPLKQISSKYFYDAEGDKLFQRIMQLDEYYLPECEKEILENHSVAIAQQIPHQAFSVIELGAGDGSKTKRMLELFLSTGKTITYRPLDISADVLQQNQAIMKEHIPQLNVIPKVGDYMQSLPTINTQFDAKLVCFMGSNLGNYKQEKAHDFLCWITDNLSTKDYFLLAQDLKKHPKKILAAYN